MIQDVEVRDLKLNTDERGHLAEIFREDQSEYDENPGMAYYSLTYPEIIRAWHRHHEGQIDYFVCPQGRIKVGIYDERARSNTKGELNTFILGEQSEKVISIPGDCWHGFKTIENKPALLVNLPTKSYDYDDPDEERIPYDSDRIPLDWEEPPITKNYTDKYPIEGNVNIEGSLDTTFVIWGKEEVDSIYIR